MNRDEMARRDPREDAATQAYGYGYGGGGAASESGGGMGMAEVARTIRRHWWFPVAGTLLFLASAWTLLPAGGVVYRATAVIRLDDARRALTGGIDGGSTENVRSTEYMLSQVHIIRSSAVIGDVVDRLGLRLQPAVELRSELIRDVSMDAYPQADTLTFRFAAGGYSVATGHELVNGTYDAPVEIAGIRFTLSQPRGLETASIAVLSREHAIDLVRRDLDPRPRDRAAIIDINYRGPDAYRAQATVNAVAEAYRAHNTKGVQDAARRRREFIDGQRLLAEEALHTAQQQLAEFRNRGRIASTQERLRAEQSALVSLDAQRAQLETERSLYQAFLRRVETARDEEVDAELRTLVSAPGISAGPLLSGLYSEFSQFQSERQRLLAGGRARTHPDVERLTTLMNGARAQVVEAARTQLASLDLRVSMLGDQRQRSASAINALPDPETEELRLAQAVATAQATANVLRGEYERARIAEAVEVGQAEILDLAAGAFPLDLGRRTQKLFIATLFGFMLGSGGALLRESINPSVRWRGELESLIAVPGLGVIPDITGHAAGKGKAVEAAASNGKVAVGSNGNGHSAVAMNGNGRTSKPPARAARLLPASSFHSPAAEAYRVLRTNLVFLRGAEALQTIAVVSGASGEGKSTTAANLAVSYARKNLRVVLVDCDLRQPSLHRMLNTKPSPGVLDFFAGRCTLEEAMHATGVEGLTLLPRGVFDERAAELLDSSRTDELIAALKSKFDIVIFDTAPVLATADTAMLAPRVDGVLLVVRAGRTPRAAARHTMQQLHAVGASVVGFVLNDPDSIVDRYDVYAYAGEYYAAKA